VYYRGARPYAKEVQPSVHAAFDSDVKLVVEGDTAVLHLTLDEAVQKAATTLVTTELLGKAKIPGVAYENPDGSAIKIDTDYFGKPRIEANPTPGPFENAGTGRLALQVR
jgi:hypothetical protein